MKRFIGSALLTGGIMIMTACSPEASDDSTSKETAAGNQDKVAAGNRKVQATEVALKDDLLNAVYQHYIQLTAALVNGDAAEARVAANAIELGLKKMPKGSAMARLTAKISATDDIERQRSTYASLSELFIKQVKTSGVSQGKIYVEYCPMAMDDQGASWLSNQQDIRNPYFGDAMLDCGTVKETLE